MQVVDERRRITIAILALGGQGGGVLADWIVMVGEACGYVTQATSVPGVAQRTGSTIYYVEMFRPGESGAEPILALMPAPGDVDIVIASELMEAGRAILRGFVSARTTLIASTHREYAIAEKSGLGDGRAKNQRILDAAERRAGHFIGFDMQDVAARTGSVISAVMFGALSGSGHLPFPRAAYEDAIRAGRKAVSESLAAHAAGHDAAGQAAARPQAGEETKEPAAGYPTTATGRALHERLLQEVPEPVRPWAAEGVRRLMDYQDARYASLYLDRLETVVRLDSVLDRWNLSEAAARRLALWMSYEDVIRVADLKTRSTRFVRVKDEVRARPGQLVTIVDYLHPRLEEVCETLPAALGARLIASSRAAAWLRRLFARGRRISTTKVSGFLLLSMIASLRRFRRGTLRYGLEQERMEAWLDHVRAAAAADRKDLAYELVELQTLVKGYGDTHARGLANYTRIIESLPRLRRRGDAGDEVRRLRAAALADDEGHALSDALRELAA
jgi:indolepyruvate ferredoxin oxidoreductase beta subunit